MTGLSQKQVDQYREDGFLFPLNAMDAEKANNYRTRLEALEAKFADRGPRQTLSQYFRVNAHIVMPLAMELAKTPEILDAIESIIGPDILVWSVEFFIKEAHTTAYVSWHQDLHYWGLSDTDEVTAWVALSPATVASGCMRFIPGTHMTDDAPHRDTFSRDNLLSRGQELEVAVDDSTAVDAELQPGQMSLHHGRMFHASYHNQTNDRRIGVAIRYIKPSMRQSNGTRTMATLVKGEDTHNHFELTPPPAGNLVAADLERALTARKRADEILFETAAEAGRRT